MLPTHIQICIQQIWDCGACLYEGGCGAAYDMRGVSWLHNKADFRINGPRKISEVCGKKSFKNTKRSLSKDLLCGPLIKESLRIPARPSKGCYKVNGLNPGVSLHVSGCRPSMLVES